MNFLHRFLRKWALSMGALVVVIGALAGFRHWMDAQLNAPVAHEYVEFLDFLADHSAHARAYRASYYHHFARDTVASQHFEQVCATMLRMAESDGASAPDHTAAMADGCRKFIPKYSADALPRA